MVLKNFMHLEGVQWEVPRSELWESSPIASGSTHGERKKKPPVVCKAVKLSLYK